MIYSHNLPTEVFNVYEWIQREFKVVFIAELGKGDINVLNITEKIMATCYHCGEEVLATYYCEGCQKGFCGIHIDPLIHECRLVKEYDGKSEGPQVSYNYIWIRPPDGARSKQSKKKKKGSTKNWKTSSIPFATIILTLLILIFSILTLPEIYFRLFFYSFYSAFDIIIWDIVTSFVSVSMNYYVDLLFLSFSLVFFTLIALDLEKRYGTKLMFGVYFLSAGISCGIAIVVRYLCIVEMPISGFDWYFRSLSLAWAGVLGLTAFRVFEDPNGQWTMYSYYIPVKMKGRTLLVVLIAMRLGFGLLYGLGHFLVFLLYVVEIFGILGGYLAYKTILKK